MIKIIKRFPDGNLENPNTIILWGLYRLSASLQSTTFTSGYIHLGFDQSHPYVPKKLRLGHRDRVSFALDLSQLQ